MALTAHITTAEPKKITKGVTALCQDKYDIVHCTVQINDVSDQLEHQFEKEIATDKSVELEYPIMNSPIRFSPNE